jgi:hypothetical protein
VANEAPPVQVALDPDPRLQEELLDDPQQQARRDARNERDAFVPLILSGIASGHAINLDGETATISAPGMQSRTIPWSGTGGRFSLTGYSHPFLTDSHPHNSITLPGWMVREFAGKMVSIHVTYAVTELEAESPAEVPFNGVEMDVPQNGHCTQRNADADISCQYALASPSLTHITWKLQESCATTAATDIAQQEWVGGTEHSIREFEFSPLASFSPSFNTRYAPDRDPRVYVLCPGSALTFTKYHVARRRLIDVTLPSLDPRVYVHVPRQMQDAAAADSGSE